MNSLLFGCGTVTAMAVGLSLCVISTTASAIVWRDDVGEQAYLDLGSQFTAVGQLTGTQSHGWNGRWTSDVSASGILIAPDVVLTAAHVVWPASSLEFAIGGQTYKASEWTTYPRSHGWMFGGYDIALIKLDTAVVGIDPVVRYTGTDLTGQEAVMVGYGYGGDGLTGYDSTTAMVERAATNTIDYVSKKGRLILTDFDSPAASVHAIFDNPLGSDDPTSLEGAIAPGDSGGGLFVNVNGQYQLAGVNSFTTGLNWFRPLFGEKGGWLKKPAAEYGDLSGFTSILSLNDWIDQTIAADSFADLKENNHRWAWGRGFHWPRRLPWGGEFVGADVDDDRVAAALPKIAAVASAAGVNTSIQNVPEPSSLALLAVGAIVFWLGVKRRGS